MITQRNQKFGKEDTLAEVIRKAEEMQGRYTTSIEFHDGSKKGRIYGTGISVNVGMGEDFC